MKERLISRTFTKTEVEVQIGEEIKTFVFKRPMNFVKASIAILKILEKESVNKTGFNIVSINEVSQKISIPVNDFLNYGEVTEEATKQVYPKSVEPENADA